MKIKLLNEFAKVPVRGSPHAAGYDLCATEEVRIYPNYRETIGTGISVEIPDGYYGQIAPRSGLAVRNGIITMAGIIDSDYRGEIKVVLYNSDGETMLHVNKGDRIAQLIIHPYRVCEFEVVEELSDTVRAEGGFGSTGVQ